MCGVRRPTGAVLGGSWSSVWAAGAPGGQLSVHITSTSPFCPHPCWPCPAGSVDTCDVHRCLSPVSVPFPPECPVPPRCHWALLGDSRAGSMPGCIPQHPRALLCTRLGAGGQEGAVVPWHSPQPSRRAVRQMRHVGLRGMNGWVSVSSHPHRLTSNTHSRQTARLFPTQFREIWVASQKQFCCALALFFSA